MSCDECFDCADQMIEELLSGENSLPEDFIAHMRGCPACLSELESLGEIVAIDMGQDPAEIMRKLHSRLERVE